MTMNSQLHPDNNEEVDEMTQREAAGLSNMVFKLKNVVAKLPDIAANDITRAELRNLLREAEGSYKRIRAEIIRQRTPDS